MARLLAAILLVFGLLPIANWIPGGHEAPWYAERLDLWLSGGAIVLGLSVIAFIVLRKQPRLWPEGRFGLIAGRWHSAGWRADAAIGLFCCAVYSSIAWWVLSARPLLIDEIIQLYQAQIFAAGRLWLPTSLHPEFSSALHLIDMAGKVYGQFPAGGPAMLTLGVLVGVPWLVCPVAGGIAVVGFARLMRVVEPRQGTALAATLLFGLAPFTAFLAGSMMNHITTTAWLVCAAWALAVTTRGDRPRAIPAALTGLCLGVAATIRPLDAAAFALPAGVWLLVRAVRDRRQLWPLISSGIGIAVPLVILFLINAEWTGDPFRFGYIELWGRTHELGFHEAPWGFPHTPTRGVELVNLYLLRLQIFLFETPVPSLLFATGALALRRRSFAFERFVLAATVFLLLVYWAYWHDGFYLGPRFMLPLAPWLAWWTAQFPAALQDRGVSQLYQRTTLFAGVTALLIAAVQLIPLRAARYHSIVTKREFGNDLAEAHGVKNALILTRDSWGAQLIARMWVLGVSRTEAERIYRSTDSCILDHEVTAVERSGGGDTELIRRLAPFRADSARLARAQFLPDSSLRGNSGVEWTGRCLRRVIEDRAGTTPFAPLLLEHGHGNIYLRDLHARDTLLADSLKNREWWLLTRAPLPGSPLRLERVDRDSARAEWADTLR